MEAGKTMIAESDCITCHSMDERKIGPPFIQIAGKYSITESTVDRLAKKIITGGPGKWGTVPMTPHPNLTEEDAKTIVKYILSLKKQ